MNVFSQSIRRSLSKDPNLLPDLANFTHLLIASDYSGHHQGCRYESYSYLIVGMGESWLSWEASRLSVRQRFKLAKRSFAYKKLNDSRKREALDSFLAASEVLAGLCVTVLIDKSITSMFDKEGRVDFSDPLLHPYSQFGIASFERLLRVVHLASFFVAGLSAPGQNITWFTDRDDIAANHARLTQLTSAWATVLSNYLSHPLGHLRCGTTESDNGTLQIEDLTAIPDLAAGALAEMATCYDKESHVPDGPLIVPPPNGVSEKTRSIIRWLSNSVPPLKRMIYVIHPVGNTSTLTIKRLQLHSGQAGLVW